MQSFNHAEFKRKVKKGRNKSKQSKAWNTSRWPSNGKQVGLVAKWQGLRWGSIVLAAVLQEKHFSSLVWATLFPHSAVVLTLAGQDRRQAWPNEKQTPFTPVLPISPCGFFVFKEKKERSPKIDLGLACQWVLKPFFPLPLVTQVAWQDLEERAGEKTELVRDRTIRGGKKSLRSVWRKDCGKLRMEHPWSLVLCWRNREQRLPCKLQVWGVYG